jgi:hypothetical protein
MNLRKAITKGAIVILLLISLAALFPMAVEWSGKRNTDYGGGYSPEQFDQIEIGMPQESVRELVGDPIERGTNKDYPVWALREDSVRERLDIDAKFDMEVWSYSRPRNSRQDYELVQVAFGPEQKVIEKDRWVTD